MVQRPGKALSLKGPPAMPCRHPNYDSCRELSLLPSLPLVIEMEGTHMGTQYQGYKSVPPIEGNGQTLWITAHLGFDLG